MLAHSIVFLDGDFDGVPVPPPDWARFCARECRLIGCEAAHPDLIPELCALDARGELSLDELVTPISPSEIPAVLAARRAGRPGGRIDQMPIVRLD
jgi:hypothetical protein